MTDKPDKSDILDRSDIVRLVNAFYTKVRADEPLGHVFAGENAGHIVRCAEDMARVIHSKIHAIPNPRLDPGPT